MPRKGAGGSVDQVEGVELKFATRAGKLGVFVIARSRLDGTEIVLKSSGI